MKKHRFPISYSLLALAAAAALPAMAQAAGPMAEGGNETKGFDMAPETKIEVVQAAVDALPTRLPAGPFKPEWQSLRENYEVPQWLIEGKFGLFMHWGLYSVPAYKSEWYEKHMYGNAAVRDWHVRHFGPIDQFGYKDFIPKFTNDKF